MIVVEEATEDDDTRDMFVIWKLTALLSASLKIYATEQAALTTLQVVLG